MNLRIMNVIYDDPEFKKLYENNNLFNHSIHAIIENNIVCETEMLNLLASLCRLIDQQSKTINKLISEKNNIYHG